MWRCSVVIGNRERERKVMSEPLERKPVYRCRRIDPVQVDIEDGDESTKAFVLSLLHLGEVQAYSVYRYDNQTTTSVFYHPTKRLLIVFYDGTMEGASEIPSMYQGLKWWIQEPEIWKEHLVSN